MPRTPETRHERHYGDAEIRQKVMKQAATPMGASKSILKDWLYSYADRSRVTEIIEALVRDGALITASFKGGMGLGRGSTRAFVSREHAEAFARGDGPLYRPNQRAASRQKSAPTTASGAPKLHDKLDSMGTHRGQPLTNLRKPGSNARRLEPLVLNRPPESEARITDRTRVTIAPTCLDQRYTVRELPPGYRSELDPREARPWAQAAAEARA